MGGQTFLTRVVMENFKSIARCDVRLGPLTYLVGPNGSGKSNFLDGLRFVADALKHSAGEALRSRGGGASVCHAPNRNQGYFRVHLEFRRNKEEVGYYSVKVGQPTGASPSSPWEVLEEQFDLPEQQVETGPGTYFRDRLTLAILADQPEYREVYLALTRMLCYNIKPWSIEDIVTFDPGEFLLPSGSNLASVIYGLSSAAKEVLDRINDYLCLILPNLERVRAAIGFKDPPGLPLDRPKVGLRFEQRFEVGTHLFWPSAMSEGTLRAFGILTALLQAAVLDGPKPSLVAIEDPEAHVHPVVVGVLRDAMTEASYSTQVLATTQSADLLDNKDVAADSILAVTAENGSTYLAPIDANGRDMIRRRLYTPGELLRIGQLVPERNGNAPANDRPVPTNAGEES